MARNAGQARGMRGASGAWQPGYRKDGVTASGMGAKKSVATVRSEIQPPLGFTVRTTHEYWERIVGEKHRNMRGREDGVKDTLSHPDEIKQSVTDPDVLLFYHSRQEGWTVAVAVV